MDYTALAEEFMEYMHTMRKSRPHKDINDALQGAAFVLFYIAHKKGGDVVPGEISGEMCVSSARVAAALNSLEDKGLITREIDKTDRRRVLVNLTQAGRELEEQHHREVLEQTVSMLSLLGEEDAREYVRLTAKLAAVTSRQREENL